MQSSDPRADPTVVDLIELAGLWIAAGDWYSLRTTLQKLDDELSVHFSNHQEFAARFRELNRLVSGSAPAEEIRRVYRRASVG